MSKTLRLNVNYIILFKIPKNQLSQIYIDQPININKELFYKIISELNKYENIIIDLKIPIEKFQIRKNLNEILFWYSIYKWLLTVLLFQKIKIKVLLEMDLSMVKKHLDYRMVKKADGLSNLLKKGCRS